MAKQFARFQDMMRQTLDKLDGLESWRSTADKSLDNLLQGESGGPDDIMSADVGSIYTATTASTALDNANSSRYVAGSPVSSSSGGCDTSPADAASSDAGVV